MKRLLFTFIFISIATLLSAEDRLVFSAISNSIDSEITSIVLKEAYGRLGLEIEIEDYPGVRALEYSNSGITNGETNRVGGIDKIYTNLVQVPVPLTEIVAIAYTADPNISIENWQELSGYKVGIRRGVKFAEKGTADVEGIKLYIANTEFKLYQLLFSGRVDIIVAPERSYFEIKKIMGDKKLYPLEPPLEVLYLYHYLHKDKSYLLPDITTTLQELKDEGFKDKIIEDTLNAGAEHFADE